ncbi:hypothetical protein K443DRAFT_360114 [Laccaria amethystina LaAM-08-1]|uniref:Phosphatidylglycerol/phosphatidylinositol transfer protein n=1 Tax=Laccaria amethystina LaAM-08-1 TaxID=1095629 RepID=A0A0C9WZQ1_9AGAR|nr:hypothetical protein K443DRAFT_360114 [Laccaria amethystina LaAM-08-1]
MKLLSLLVSIVFAFAATSQTIDIGYPTNSAVLHAGEQLTAEIDRPNSIIGCIEVGIALAIISCVNGQCPSPSERLGSVLYAGPFNPQAHGGGRFYQNFTVTVPSFLPNGQALFTLTHLCLLGVRQHISMSPKITNHYGLRSKAGPFPLLEYRNATVTIT